METEEITSTRETAKSFYTEESERSKTRRTHLPDPGSSRHSSAEPPSAGFIIHDTDLDNLRLDFPMLAKYSDDFLRSTP
jgi:hypothetical protein